MSTTNTATPPAGSPPAALALSRQADGRVLVVEAATGWVLFEVLADVDERGQYVQIRGSRLRQVTVEPRADNVIRVREA